MNLGTKVDSSRGSLVSQDDDENRSSIRRRNHDDEEEDEEDGISNVRSKSGDVGESDHVSEYTAARYRSGLADDDDDDMNLEDDGKSPGNI